ncbi:MAG: hypothetical protein WAM14_24815 [Candidatus Nitrosopolaris sp.]
MPLNKSWHDYNDSLIVHFFSFRITRGNVHDAKKFCPLVREAAEKYNIDKYVQTKRTITETILTYWTT